MLKSKSVPTIKNPGWVKRELTGIDRKIRAKEIGKHHKRVNEQTANIDNEIAQINSHYQHLRQRLFTIQQQNTNKKIANDNVELLRHLITLSQDAPNYKTYPKSPLLKFSQQMSKISRSRNKKEIKAENKRNKQRLKSIKPSKSLKAINMAKDFAHHRKLQKQFAVTHNFKRKQPDVIEYKKKKLSKKERIHFRKPLKRPQTARNHNNKKRKKNCKRRQRPMTPNTYKYKQQNVKKKSRVQSARKNITNLMLNVTSSNNQNTKRPNTERSLYAKSKNNNNQPKSSRKSYINTPPKSSSRKSSSKWSAIITEDLQDFGVNVSPRSMDKFKSTISSPAYIVRASKIYDHKRKRK